jgi:hypothetical protein
VSTGGAGALPRRLGTTAGPASGTATTQGRSGASGGAATARGAGAVTPARVMPPPAVKAELSLLIAPELGAKERLITVSNAQRISLGRPVATITCSQGADTVWTTCTHCNVTAVAGTSTFTAVAMQDNTLQLLSTAGRRLLPPLALSSPVALIGTAKDLLIVLLSSGDVRTWDVARGKVLPPSLFPHP